MYSYIFKFVVAIYSPTGISIITGWCETDRPRLWRMSLMPNPEDMPPIYSAPDDQKTSLQYFSAYDPPIVEALVGTSMQLHVSLSETHG